MIICVNSFVIYFLPLYVFYLYFVAFFIMFLFRDHIILVNTFSLLILFFDIVSASIRVYVCLYNMLWEYDFVS